MTRIILTTCTATTKVESSCSVTAVVAISAIPPGEKARMAVMTEIPVISAIAIELRTVAAISPAELTTATMRVFLARQTSLYSFLNRWLHLEILETQCSLVLANKESNHTL